MFFKRINKNTINCIITQDDLVKQGIQVEDFLNRKEEAMAFLREVILEAAREENFTLTGDYTSMRISLLPDHSISLTLTDGVPQESDGNKEIHELINRLRSKTNANTTDSKAAGAGTKPHSKTENAKAGQADPAAGSSGHRSSIDSCGFVFYSMNDVINCCRTIADRDCYRSSLYEDTRTGEFYLLLNRKGSDQDAEFEKVCLSINEFGEPIEDGPEYLSYIREHDHCLLKEDAVSQLAKL